MLSFLKRFFGQAVKSAGSIAPDSPIGTAAPAASTKSGIAADKKPQPVGAASQMGAAIRFTSDEAVAEPLWRKVATKRDVTAEQLKAWTCSKCGAALPNLDAEKTLKCASCGTVFRVPQASTSRPDGVYFNGGNIVIHGSVVGGDLVSVNTTKTQALSEMFAELSKQSSDSE
jgi:hypothetical protein